MLDRDNIVVLIVEALLTLAHSAIDLVAARSLLGAIQRKGPRSPRNSPVASKGSLQAWRVGREGRRSER
ncbi:hypothetical protein TIFTF001_037613 [Ficus carica]|uniref:Uncharacterized protein n=1 Tax=Ficus carica TaxID=3494 RepID=A0AA88JDS9_FICCA|nr:hypothetical protein TIFTF001_037582 [Ficus carica]GMN68556.1 hypothetical protein TIFTF001_037613 [Ficus carica]